jgi:hypothetical protein
MNQLQNKKNKTYFITSTKGRNQYDYTSTPPIGDTRRPNTAANGFMPKDKEVLNPNIQGFTPDYHGWLTGIESTSEQDKFQLTFSDIFSLFDATIADKSSRDSYKLGAADVRQEFNNNLNYLDTQGKPYIDMIIESMLGLVNPTTNKNGLPVFTGTNFKDPNNRTMTTMKKIDERIYAGLRYQTLFRNSELYNFTVGNTFSFRKYISALDAFITLSQSQGRVEITPDICLVPAQQPGLTGPYYEWYLDFFPANFTKTVNVTLNQVDIKYDTMDSDFATNVVVQDLSDSKHFADGYHGWLYGGELGYPVVKYINNNQNPDDYETYLSATISQNVLAETEHRRLRNRYLKLSVRQEDVDFGNTKYDNSYFIRGDKLDVYLEELDVTFPFVIEGIVVNINPSTFTETTNFILERRD